MLLELNRKWLTEQSTIGELTHDGVRLCFTLEDRYRGDSPADKVAGKTCIPCGSYEIIIIRSPRFQMDMPLLLGVPGFVGIRIHAGNDASDTDGCILVGLDRGPDQIHRSQLAYAKVFQLIQAARAKNEIVRIDVKLADGGSSNA